MLDIEIINEIICAWAKAGKSRNFPEMVSSVPNRVDLKALLETVFLSSVEYEEGVSTRVRVVFYPEATPTTLKDYAKWIDVLPFGAEIELTAENLAKLGPAFDQDSTALAVARRQEEHYVIVGALFYGKKISRLDSGQGTLGRPQALTLSVRAPGSVVVSFSDSVVGRFERGQFIHANPGPMASTIFTSYVIRVISGHAEYRKFKMEYWYLYRECLERLYLTASEKGHGSTIIWLPGAMIDDASSYLQAGTLISSERSGNYLAGMVLERSTSGNYDPVLADNRRKLAEFLDVLAYLSCVDGALIIDDELKPHRFRCHLAASKWHGRVLEGTVGNVSPSKTLDTTRFGTRHNSAISFVGACPGAIALVISEDGPVRAVMRCNEDVIIWPDCLNTVFLD